MPEKIMKIAEDWLSQNLTPNNQTLKPFGINTPDSYKSVNFKTLLSPVFSRPLQLLDLKPVLALQTPSLNTSKEETYNTRWKNYLAELGKSKNRININKARKHFDSLFEQDWNNEVASRNVDFALNLAKQKQNDIIGKFRALREEAARLSLELDALDYEAAGYTYDAATGKWNKPVTPVLKPKTDWNAVAVSALGEGNNMETVSKLQELLHNAGYNIAIDGKFGNETRAAYEDYMNSSSYKKPSQPATPVTSTPQNTDVFTSNSYNAAGLLFTLGKVNSEEEFNDAYSKFAGERKGFWSGGSWATGRDWDKARDEMYNKYLKFYGLSSLLPSTTMSKNGGRINKHQQGGTMGNQEELQKAFMAFLIEDAAAQGMQIQSEQDLQAYAQQLGEEGLKAKYQEFMQKMQGGVKAALGAKLNYIHKLKGNCPEGEELVYMKQGGRMCPVCQKKAEKAEDGKKLKKNAVSDFKEKRKKINPNDTVNTKFGPRDLNGKTKYPKYDATKENYDYETRKRVQEKDEKSGKKVLGSACGSKMKKK